MNPGPDDRDYNSRHNHIGHQLCPKCGYDLFGINSSVCPECGEHFDRENLLRVGGPQGRLRPVPLWQSVLLDLTKGWVVIVWLGGVLLPSRKACMTAGILLVPSYVLFVVLRAGLAAQVFVIAAIFVFLDAKLRLLPRGDYLLFAYLGVPPMLAIAVEATRVFLRWGRRSA